jgi:hypothetical protein
MPDGAEPDKTTPKGPVLDRKEFLERRNRLEDSAKESQRTADKLLVSGAGGALILSITFIDVIARSPRPETRWFLILAWIALLACLIVSFLSHFASDRAFRAEIAKADAEYGGVEIHYSGRWDRITLAMNGLASLALLVGLVLLATFALENTQFRPLPHASPTDSVTTVRLRTIESQLDSILARGVRPVPPPPRTTR